MVPILLPLLTIKVNVGPVRVSLLYIFCISSINYPSIDVYKKSYNIMNSNTKFNYVSISKSSYLLTDNNCFYLIYNSRCKRN